MSCVVGRGWRVASRIQPSKRQLLGREATFGEGPGLRCWREAAPCGSRLSDDSRWVVAPRGGIRPGRLTGHTSRSPG